MRNASNQGDVSPCPQSIPTCVFWRDGWFSSQTNLPSSSIDVTNLGGIGGAGFTPIINSPEVAILGISRASHQAVFSDGQFQRRLMLPIAVSFDHRVVDGADAARFARWIANGLEQPFMLKLEGEDGQKGEDDPPWPSGEESTIERRTAGGRARQNRVLQ